MKCDMMGCDDDATSEVGESGGVRVCDEHAAQWIGARSTPWTHLSPAHMGLARHMFDRSVASYDADPEEANLAWLDEGIRDFWLHEAWACLIYLANLEEC